ncbi:MAG: phosphate regulon transcriptional regulator PhoB [Candidatus Accumulibacter sp.]|jgi:two-component system phosphate regulon response regulator PhoB|nr:phosphate regulon transcriptional regulator PhoB [Accumulibacter sp.]
MALRAIPKPRVLVVEDQADILELILVNLRHAGYDPVPAADGPSACAQLNAILPDVILLDWMLPGAQSGLDLARRWRADPRSREIPILMLTAKGEENDKVLGLESGADDYITKPFSNRELLARIHAVLRRRAPEQLGDSVSVGALSLHAGQFRVSFAGKELKLGPTEFRLLHYLMKYPERVMSRAHLLDKVWGDHVFIEERTVDVHIKRLRAALGKAGGMIETVRSEGYRLTAKAAR